MSEFVLKNASVTINAVDLSDHVRSVTINHGAEMKEITAMGDDSKERLAGLKDWSVEVEFNQDHAADEVDATLFSLVGAVAFAILIKPTSAAVSATNPSYGGNCLLESYPPMGGGVGDEATTSATFQGSGDLTRSTS